MRWITKITFIYTNHSRECETQNGGTVRATETSRVLWPLFALHKSMADYDDAQRELMRTAVRCTGQRGMWSRNWIAGESICGGNESQCFRAERGFAFGVTLQPKIQTTGALRLSSSIKLRDSVSYLSELFLSQKFKYPGWTPKTQWKLYKVIGQRWVSNSEITVLYCCSKFGRTKTSTSPNLKVSLLSVSTLYCGYLMCD